MVLHHLFRFSQAFSDNVSICLGVPIVSNERGRGEGKEGRRESKEFWGEFSGIEEEDSELVRLNSIEDLILRAKNGEEEKCKGGGDGRGRRFGWECFCWRRACSR